MFISCTQFKTFSCAWECGKLSLSQIVAGAFCI